MKEYFRAIGRRRRVGFGWIVVLIGAVVLPVAAAVISAVLLLDRYLSVDFRRTRARKGQEMVVEESFLTMMRTHAFDIDEYFCLLLKKCLPVYALSAVVVYYAMLKYFDKTVDSTDSLPYAIIVLCVPIAIILLQWLVSRSVFRKELPGVLRVLISARTVVIPTIQCGAAFLTALVLFIELSMFENSYPDRLKSGNMQVAVVILPFILLVTVLYLTIFRGVNRKQRQRI
ncbi:MAG: hypothetical protein IKX54_05015 [Lachnospiraceae bacterium]|nr:hypothetical protein [Lachnospiraceae bacterium]